MNDPKLVAEAHRRFAKLSRQEMLAEGGLFGKDNTGGAT